MDQIIIKILFISRFYVGDHNKKVKIIINNDREIELNKATMNIFINTNQERNHISDKSVFAVTKNKKSLHASTSLSSVHALQRRHRHN